MENSEEVLGRLKTQSYGSRAAAGNPEQKVPAQTKAELVYGVNTLKRHCFLHTHSLSKTTLQSTLGYSGMAEYPSQILA